MSSQFSFLPQSPGGECTSHCAPFPKGSIGTCDNSAVAMEICCRNPSGICHPGRQTGGEPVRHKERMRVWEEGGEREKERGRERVRKKERERNDLNGSRPNPPPHNNGPGRNPVDPRCLKCSLMNNRSLLEMHHTHTHKM